MFCGGPILIAEYMEEVLTNPKAGFYINGDVFGTEDAFKFKCFTGSLHIHMVECSPTLQNFQHSYLKCKDEDTNDKVNKRSVSTLARTPVTWHAALKQVPSGCMKLSSTSRHT
ncbi:protein arginine methyltransferase NDUFAF7 homolog, mitochondrial isoform X2 [Fagus crenata]